MDPSRDLTLKSDVTIVGAAMVGATLAVSLAKSGLDVVLIEKRSPAPVGSAPAVTEIQSTALSRASINILQSLGLWQWVETTAVPIRQVHVSQAGNFGALRMSAKEQGVEALGAIVDNAIYNDALTAMLHSEPRVTLLSPAQLIGVVENTGSQSESVSTYCEVDGKHCCIESGLLIGVDGVNSGVRKCLDIETRVTDYQQSAVLVNVETSEINDGIAFERFTSDGPMACLPLGGHMNSVVCSIDGDDHERFTLMSSDELCESLQQRFGYRLGRFRKCGPHHVLALKLTESRHQSQGRSLLIGNAARTLHPVAGQGFNLALRDVGLLLELIRAESRPLESLAMLANFQKLRARDHAVTVGVTDSLARLFRGANEPFSHLRALGLLGIEHLPGLRGAFAHRAMGLASRLPDLSGPPLV